MKIISRKLILTAIAVLTTFLFACNNNGDQDGQAGEKKWNRTEAEREYEFLKSEYILASAVKPYMVFNFKKKELEIRLKGAVVWSAPLDVIDDSENFDDFTKTFKGDENKLVRPLLEKHLFAYSNKTPDSILVIVGEAVSADPKLMQREVPERFQLLWNKNLVLDVRTNVAGKPISRFKNTLREIRRMIQKPFGESLLIIRMDPELALTLYRACEPGIPTMVYPKSFK